jgi:hypothetical protein
MDFMNAKTIDGHWLRVLTVIDQFTRDAWRWSRIAHSTVIGSGSRFRR